MCEENKDIKLTPETPLYRIMPLEQLLDMLESNTNTLVRPSKWEDPYEKLLMVSKIINDESEERNIESLDWKRWYGQCWSYIKESDSLWRAFTNGKNVRCVKVSTTYAKLKGSLKSSPTQQARHAVPFLEDVSYIDNYQEGFDNSFIRFTKTFIGSLNLPNTTDKEAADYYVDNAFVFTLLQTKRKAFEHESEIRLLAFEEGEVEEYDKDSVYQYEIKPKELIEKIEFDPWTPPYLHKSYLNLMEKYGFKNENGKEIVSFSKLYNKPDKGIEIHISNPQIIQMGASAQENRPECTA